MFPERSTQWKPIAKRRGRHRDVECYDFSFIDNPIETMETFKKIVDAECKAKGFYIHFNDKYVLDVGPFLLFGALRKNMTPVVLGGRISDGAQKVVEAIQLREFLQMSSFGNISDRNVWALPLRQRRRGGDSESSNVALESSTVEKTADRTVESVNEWLGTLAPAEELTPSGEGSLRTIVTEALDNSERHGREGGDGEWIMAGFMARREIVVDGTMRPVHICHIGLMNLGRTIPETIQEAPPALKEQLERYQKLHRGGKISTDSLAMVFALQDGISRVEQGSGRPSGGTGMMDIVEFANDVGRFPADGLHPKVAIVSGKSYVRFAPPYERGVATPDGRRLQWFNEANVVDDPPDSTFVVDLPYAFPGTLVSARFVLDESLGD